jgi:hypothetical protein
MEFQDMASYPRQEHIRVSRHFAFAQVNSKTGCWQTPGQASIQGRRPLL